ncbi:MAG TPA: peptide ABC transporter substrate-binding protein [Opitutaceae bacterium]|nr:peptide ABC transporter substrate-binding protein [Opitutaceae bacterium]
MPRLLAPLLAILVLAGCGGRERDADAAIREGRFIMVVGADPQSLDPHVATGFVEYQVFMAIFEGLTRLDPRTSDPIPGTASRWDVSPDGLTYTFHLRPEAKWSNGDPVTAGDFAYSIQRMLTASLGSEYAYFIFDLKNAREFHSGAITDFSQVGVEVVNDHTLVLTLNRATPYFPAMLFHQAWMPVHRASVEAAGPMADRNSRWARPGTLVGNGPFKLVDWRNNERLIVERNPHFHGAAGVRLNSIHFLPIENTDTGDRAFRAGQVHVTDSLPPARIALYREESNPDFRSNTYLGTAFAIFNTTRKPLDDPRVRKAISLACDRKTLVERVARAGQEPAGSFTPPGTAGYEPPLNPLFDPEAARALLAEAGYPGGKGFPTIEVTFPSSNNTQLVMEALQEMWRRELGINVTLANIEWKVFLDNLSGLNYDIALMSWVGDYIDPNTFLTTMTSTSGNNRTGWKNAQFDALVDRAGDNPDRGARFLRLGEAERILLDDQPIAPIWHLTRSYLIHPAVRGYYPNLLDLHPYQDVWLEEVKP